MKTLLVLSVFFVVAMSAPETLIDVDEGQTLEGIDWTKVYGPGLINQPPTYNPVELQNAQKIANSVPESMIRINLDGSIDITDRYGHEVILVAN